MRDVVALSLVVFGFTVAELLEPESGLLAVTRADRHLDLAGLGKLVALSRQAGLNELAAVRYQSEFGRDSVFVLKTDSEGQTHDKHQVSGALTARLWPDQETTYFDLERMLNSGGEVRTTPISEEFDLTAYRAQHPRAQVLFATDKEGNLNFPAGLESISPKPDWSVTALIAPAGGPADPSAGGFSG